MTLLNGAFVGAMLWTLSAAFHRHARQARPGRAACVAYAAVCCAPCVGGSRRHAVLEEGDAEASVGGGGGGRPPPPNGHRPALPAAAEQRDAAARALTARVEAPRGGRKGRGGRRLGRVGRTARGRDGGASQPAAAPHDDSEIEMQGLNPIYVAAKGVEVGTGGGAR